MLTPDLDRIRLWVEALESGEYQQGFGTLRSSLNRYCCLGVACEVAIRNGLVIDARRADNGEYLYNGCSGLPPVAVREWYGIEDNPQLDLDSGRSEYASMLNDDYSMAFDEIAAAIRRTYLEGGSSDNA